MIVEGSVADAYAIAWEFTDKQTGTNDLSTYYQHPKYIELMPSCYTDDTLRSIANAEIVLERKDLFSVSTYLNGYLNSFKKDNRKGYSQRYYKLLENAIGLNALAKFRNSLSRKNDTNGAIMGAAVLGYICKPEEVALVASVQALSTHSPETIIYAQAVALMVNYHLYPRNFSGYLDDYLAKYVYGTLPSFAGQLEKCDMTAKNTYINVRRLLRTSSINYSLSELIKNAVNIGGDTDSLATIAVQIASVDPAFKNDIPIKMIDNLENGNNDFLKTLDNDLKLFKVQNEFFDQPKEKRYL